MTPRSILRAAAGPALALMLCTGPALSASPALQTPAPVTGIATRILSLAAAPDPKNLPSAPYHEPLVGVLYTPAAGGNPYGPAIVFLDEGPASHPLDPNLASRFAAQRLAAKGYTVLAIFPRINRGYAATPYASVAADIDAALDHLEAEGHEDVILAGHGLGGSAISLYMATQPDILMDSKGNKRVKASILFAPPSEELVKEGRLEKDHAGLVAKAQAWVANPPPKADPMDGPPMIAHGGDVQTPAMFLDYWGPGADTHLSKWFAKASQPALLLAGTKDDRVPRGRLEALREMAQGKRKVDLIWYPDADHAFTGLWDKTTEDVAAWLAGQGLGVAPAIRTEIVDARLEDGSLAGGVLYTPASGLDPSKPAFLLQFGTGGDVMHSATHWLAWRLAQQGYAVLSPRSRMAGTRGLQISTYAEQTSDLGRWMDVLESRGARRVILEGHSLGGILVSNYARTKDPRVAGLIYMAPTRDSPTRSREGQGEAHYAKVTREARAAVARGDGDDYVIGYMDYPAWAKDSYPEGKGMVLGGGDVGTAAHFIDFRAPGAPIHTQVIRDIKVPALAFAATSDGLMTRAFTDGFAKAYGGKIEVVWYEGSHGARESKTLIRDRIVDWVKRTFP
jgi:pimeloyl-ACP methyl ester carboxylesterase